MNTICKRCLFVNPSTGEKCFFNIPTLLKSSDYCINDIDGYNVIENYNCSYAFSKEHYEKHKEDPEFMKMNCQRSREYYDKRKDNEDFKNKLKERQKKYYQKRKDLLKKG